MPKWPTELHQQAEFDKISQLTQILVEAAVQTIAVVLCWCWFSCLATVQGAQEKGWRNIQVRRFAFCWAPVDRLPSVTVDCLSGSALSNGPACNAVETPWEPLSHTEQSYNAAEISWRTGSKLMRWALGRPFQHAAQFIPTVQQLRLLVILIFEVKMTWKCIVDYAMSAGQYCVSCLGILVVLCISALYSRLIESHPQRRP